MFSSWEIILHRPNSNISGSVIALHYAYNNFSLMGVKVLTGISVDSASSFHPEAASPIDISLDQLFSQIWSISHC
jgi:hypothetical protein